MQHMSASMYYHDSLFSLIFWKIKLRRFHETDTQCENEKNSDQIPGLKKLSIQLSVQNLICIDLCWIVHEGGSGLPFNFSVNIFSLETMSLNFRQILEIDQV